MGRGIANVMVMAGWRMRLVIVSDEQLEGVLIDAAADLDGSVQRSYCRPTPRAAIEPITTTADPRRRSGVGPRA